MFSNVVVFSSSFADKVTKPSGLGFLKIPNKDYSQGKNTEDVGLSYLDQG